MECAVRGPGSWPRQPVHEGVWREKKVSREERKSPASAAVPSAQEENPEKPLSSVAPGGDQGCGEAPSRALECGNLKCGNVGREKKAKDELSGPWVPPSWENLRRLETGAQPSLSLLSPAAWGLRGRPRLGIQQFQIRLLSRPQGSTTRRNLDCLNGRWTQRKSRPSGLLPFFVSPTDTAITNPSISCL